MNATSLSIRFAAAAFALAMGALLLVGKLAASGDFQRHMAMNQEIRHLPAVLVVASKLQQVAIVPRSQSH
jgi:hypothetical protein